MRKFDPVFSKYLTMLILFSALLFILLIPVYFYVYNFTLENELNYINNRFRLGVSSLDTAVNAVNNISVLTTMDSRFRIFSQDRHTLEQNPVMLNQLRNHFNGLLMSYPVIMDAGIIFSRDLVLTRQQIFFSPFFYSFYGNLIQCENLSMDEWLSCISDTNTFSPVLQYTSMSNGSYKGLTFSVQWKPREGQDINLVYAAFPMERILSLLAEDEILSQCAVRITGSSGNILYEYSCEKWNSRDNFRTLADMSTVSSTKFELMIPESVITGRMGLVINLMIGFAVITVFFFIGLSLFFAYKWSQPMRRFLSNIDSTKIFKSDYEQYAQLQNSGVWNYFQRLFGVMSKSISSLDTRLDESLKTIDYQTSLLREQIFYIAINQGVYSEHDIQLFASLFTEFPGFFQLAEISYEQSADSSLQAKVTVQLRLISAIKNRIENILVHSIGNNTVILLLPLNKKNESWYTKLQELRNDLNPETEEALQFSLGSVFEKPSDLPRAWEELQSISVASGIKKLISVGQINDIPNIINRIPLNITSLHMIYNMLSNGNDDKACNILRDCTSDLLKDRDMFIMEHTSNLLHEMLVLFKRENLAILINEEIPQYIRGREEDLFNIHYPDCFHRIGQLVRQSRDESISRFGEQILDYINKNLYNPGLYSMMVQDHFSISQPTMQKIIKQLTGYTFLSYVENHRLTRAKELLLEGIYPVQEISEKCGFSNTNSFYKAFKRFFGYSPSDIKKQTGEGTKGTGGNIRL